MEAHHPAGRHALSEAVFLANACVREWARCVLREVALQSLRNDMSVDDSSSRGTVAFTPGAMERARGLCNMVGQKWIEHIRSAGHFEAGEWIRNVLDTESDVLFHSPADRTRGGMSSAPASRNNTIREGATPRNPSSPTEPSRLYDVGRIGVSDALSGGVSVESGIEFFDDLGTRNATDWPFSWPVIQEACGDLMSRLHNSKRKKSSELSIHQLPSPEAHVEEADESILRRKRKSRCMLRPPANPPSVGAAEGETNRTDREPNGPVARPASNVSYQQWTNADRALSEGDQNYLEENYVPNDHSIPTFSTLLGSLNDAGRFHHFVKLSDVDASLHPSDAAGTASAGSRTVRQMKWQRRISINERLGDHLLFQQDTRGYGNASRIQRTIDGNGRHWFDFDLGHGLLDAEEPEGDGKRRRFLYFDTMEVSLLDEDRSGTDP